MAFSRDQSFALFIYSFVCSFARRLVKLRAEVGFDENSGITGVFALGEVEFLTSGAEADEAA